MPVTTLDPVTALIVVDLQRGIASLPGVHSIKTVIERSAALAKAFRARGLPVALVNVDATPPGRTDLGPRNFPRPDGWTEFVDEIEPQAGDHTVTKRTWGAFSHTDLDDWLKSKGATQVVVTGVATSAGVESTARQAHELGYNVTLATDAMTDMSADAHTNSLTRIFPRLGETGTTEDILALLTARA